MRRLVKTGLERLGYRSYHHRHFRDARIWSNDEIRKFAFLYSGDVINVSAWEDKDKQDDFYRNYFINSANYYISNFGTDQGSMQGAKNEFFIDLEKSVPKEFCDKFDVVFNHTTLEHVFEFRVAFDNLCAMSRDTVIIVVPWLQRLHASYGDYWRFSPQAVAKLFELNGMKTMYLSWTKNRRTSVYVFAIGSKRPELWVSKIGLPVDTSSPSFLVAQPDGAGAVAL